MILFVFEGNVAEPKIFESLNKLYFSQEEVKIVCCKHDLPTLYSHLVKCGYDLFRSLPLKENGKLYINYPMVESLKYTKQMPDNEFYNYIATREDCANHKFKSKAETFAYSKAKAYRFIDLNKTNEAEVAANWVLLKGQNVKKANYIVNDIMDFPTSKDAISQRQIFNAQKTKFVRPSESVSILNSFPIFLYDYFK